MESVINPLLCVTSQIYQLKLLLDIDVWVYQDDVRVSKGFFLHSL